MREGARRCCSNHLAGRCLLVSDMIFSIIGVGLFGLRSNNETEEKLGDISGGSDQELSFQIIKQIYPAIECLT
jgi:hypothetical protein